MVVDAPAFRATIPTMIYLLLEAVPKLTLENVYVVKSLVSVVA